MRLSNRVYRFQEGGMAPEGAAMDPAAAAAPAPVEASAPAGQPSEEEVMQQIHQMAQEVVSQMGPDVAMLLAQAIMEIVQGGAGMQGAGQPMPPAEAQPGFARRGGKLYRIR